MTVTRCARLGCDCSEMRWKALGTGRRELNCPGQLKEWSSLLACDPGLEPGDCGEELVGDGRPGREDPEGRAHPQPRARWGCSLGSGGSVPSSHDSKPPTEALGPTLCGLGCGRLGLCPVTGAMEEQPPEAQEAAPQKRQRKEPGAGEHLLSPSPQRQALGRALPQLRAGSGETHRSVQSGRLSVSLLALPLPACDPQQVPEFPPLEMGMTKVVSLQGGGGTQRK